MSEKKSKEIVESKKKSRAKDIGIVNESQKFFGIIKGVGILTGLIIIVVLFAFMIKGKEKPAPVKISVAPTTVAPYEKFVLKVDELTQTVEAGPGTHHRLQSDKKFIAVSIQADGSEKKYEMPAGTSYWNGAAPWGRLLLEAKEAGTRVKIAPIN